MKTDRAPDYDPKGQELHNSPDPQTLPALDKTNRPLWLCNH